MLYTTGNLLNDTKVACAKRNCLICIFHWDLYAGYF